eukprot:1144951-Pelagomonas_calceolata.AAC.2
MKHWFSMKARMKQGKNMCMQAMCTREHVFHGGATRIRLHFLQVPGCGVAKCSADTWALMRMRRGPAVMGVGLQDKRRT